MNLNESRWINRLFTFFGYSAHVSHFTSIALTIDHFARAWTIEQLFLIVRLNSVVRYSQKLTSFNEQNGLISVFTQ